jgi:hypothetical protein
MPTYSVHGAVVPAASAPAAGQKRSSKRAMLRWSVVWEVELKVLSSAVGAWVVKEGWS